MMFIKKLNLKNYRNIINLEICFDEKINLIYGKNAQGKTNLIESLYFSSHLKSFRTSKLNDIINVDSNYTSINLKVNNQYTDNDIKYILSKNNIKEITVNDKKPDKNKFFKIINSILYYPDEVSYLKIYPNYRRNFIDRSIFNLNNEYIDIVRKYNRCLKQRNIILKNNDKNLNVWTDQLIEFGSTIINYRNIFVNEMNLLLNNQTKENKINENYSIDYTKYELNKIKEDLFFRYKKNNDKEYKYGYTLVGPHTDDFIFKINDKDIRKYSSEGQKKSFLLNYKQAQLFIYKKKFGFFPILIFDDMGSELDENRKKNFIYRIIENTGQVFITTTEIPKSLSNTSIFEVDNGIIAEKKN